MRKMKMMMFDLDGTLATTGDDLALGINFTMRTLNLPEKSRSEIISFVGDGINRLMERVLGENNLSLHEEAMSIFIDYYEKHLLDNTGLYPHVKDVLDYFQNIRKIILTNKRHRFALQIARGLNIEKYFIDIVGSDSTPFCKPDGRVIDYLLDKYNIRKEDAVMIGDGANDILAARNAGILSCAYLNGLGNRDDLLELKADYVCEDLLELKHFFREP